MFFDDSLFSGSVVSHLKSLWTVRKMSKLRDSGIPAKEIHILASGTKFLQGYTI